jgi:hypothetical protein
MSLLKTLPPVQRVLLTPFLIPAKYLRYRVSQLSQRRLCLHCPLSQLKFLLCSSQPLLVEPCV